MSTQARVRTRIPRRVEATLISHQAISGTEPQAEMPMQNEAERFSAMIAPHRLRMRCASSPALQK
jgi:hypothetical protein